MTTAIQRRRGTTAQHSTFTGLAGEITVDTSKNTLVVHDGATAGGNPLPTLTGTETLTNKTLTGAALNGSLGATTPSTVVATTITGTDLTTTGNTILGNDSTDTLNVGNGGLVKDASGNVGIGVTPSAWNSAYKALQLNTQPAVWGSSDALFLTVNQFQNTSGSNRYIANGFATQYRQDGGQHQFYTAPSGTAGNPITFTQAMTLDASGQLAIGRTTAASMLDVERVAATNTTAGILNLRTSTAGVAAAGLGSFINFLTENSNGTQYETAYIGAASSNNGAALKDGYIFFSTALSSTNPVERMRIDSSGNVGIGTASPITKLDVNGAFQTNSTLYAGPTTGSAAITHRFTAGGAGSICSVQSNVMGAVAATSSFTVGQHPSASLGITYDRGNDRRYILSNHTSGEIFIGIASTAAPASGFAFTELGKFTTNGLKVTNTVGVGGTNPSTSGAGITFPATQSASTDANTLDDYEEGTWTPAITYSGTSTATYSFRNGYYTKVGNQITLTGIISFNKSTSTGNVSITGLPFTALNNTKNRSVVSVFGFGWLGTTVSLTGQILENTASISLYLNNNAATVVTDTNTDTDQDINFTCTYFGA